MQSVLNEIMRLRNDVPISIDYQNTNRYRLVAQEKDGSKTAYYFSTPIYNRVSRKLVDLRFHNSGRDFYAQGSEAQTTFSRDIVLENEQGMCTVGLGQQPVLISGREARCGNTAIMPTMNGIALKLSATGNNAICFTLNVSRTDLFVRANDKCFALMEEKFRPFAVLSCIGATDAMGNVISPARVEYEKVTDREYRIILSATSPMAQYILCECNLYENKLFQDTTVESKNPSTNNAFGGTAFIGNTQMYGEQWLYTRPDYSKFPEIMDKRILKAVLHMPKLNQSNVGIGAFKVASRFCSFGSNWNNKVAGAVPVADSKEDNGYQSLDITSLLVDQRTRTLLRPDGLILRPKMREYGFSVIGTGDSSYAPQILEINFRH